MVDSLHSAQEIVRCGWSNSNELMTTYHDTEWGVPVHDDRRLFELLILDGMQAGLSWAVVLNKRDALRAAFRGFEPETMATFGLEEIEELLRSPLIIRNRAKVEAAITNARAFLDLVGEVGSFDRYLWQFVDGEPLVNEWQTLDEVPAESEESRRMARDLKHSGFRFVGPTICYAFMQSAGMVNDHLVTCYRHAEIRDRVREGEQPS